MNIYYVGSIPVSDELYHHGILGQKWGIRRYQNKDGTLTAEGKKRYGRNVSEQEAFDNFLKEDKRTQYEMAVKYGTVDPKVVKKDIKSGNKDALYDDFQGVLNGLNKTDEKIQKAKEEQKQRYEDRNAINKLAEDNNIGTYDEGVRWGEFEKPKRYIEATNLGLNALKRMGRLDNDGEWTNGDRDWFAFEDQTLGLGTISDLISRGKTKSEVISLLDKADEFSKKYNQYPEGPASELIFAVESTPKKELEEFIDACFEEKAIKHGMHFANTYFGKIL